MSHNFKYPESLPNSWFSKISKGIFDQNPEVLAFYPNSGPKADFEKIIEKKQSFSVESRQVLVKVLLAQYGNLAQGKVLENIHKLENRSTFTVTTGQQIHLGLGPLYVVYKALSTIQLAKDLESKFPDNSIVPVFWMATEDHDFDEIRDVRVFNRTYTWNQEHGGPVGRLNTENIAQVFDTIAADFSKDQGLQDILRHFKEVYSTFTNLADATRFLLNELFHEYGLVIIDPDSVQFKKAAISLFATDLQTDLFYAGLKQRTADLKKQGLEIQIGARPCNLFLLVHGKRIRIEKRPNGFALAESEQLYSTDELLEMLQKEPDRFSPNVALRPLYQEVVLPNIAYVGGPGELIYWFQLEPLFALANIPAPALIQRHSFIWPDRKSMEILNSDLTKLDFYFKSESEFQEHFFQNRIEDSQIVKGVSDFETVSENINKALYLEKSIHLKEVKKMGEEYLKLLKNAREAYFNAMKTTGKTAEDWNKHSKVKAKYFSPDSAQEREIHFLEMKVLHSTFPHDLLPLPNLSQSLLWVLCD